MRLIVAAVAAMAISVPAQADNVRDDGNELMEVCRKGRESTFMDGLCVGLVRGAANAMDIIARDRHCRPAGVTVGQVRDVVVAYMRSNPQELHNNTLVIVADAQARAWPCSRV